MINFLLGFWTADLLLSLVLYFKKEIVLSIDKNIVFVSILVDLILITFLLFLKYGKHRKS